MNSVLTPDELEEIGRALFGDRWQTPLSDALGFSDPVRIRQMLTQKRAVTSGMLEDMVGLLDKKQSQCATLVRKYQ